MPEIPNDIPPWRPVLYDGHSKGLAEGARTLFRVAIEPACIAVARELEAISDIAEREAITRRQDLRDTQLELHRSFALALGGQWERHFQRHLAHSASVIRAGEPNIIAEIERGTWAGLSAQFEKVRGFPLSKFRCHDTLKLLCEVSSAVRHGNGRSTKNLYNAHPGLFSHQPINGWFAYFTYGGEPEHSIHRLDVSFGQLIAFKDAIVEFWETISALQISAQNEASPE